MNTTDQPQKAARSTNLTTQNRPDTGPVTASHAQWIIGLLATTLIVQVIALLFFFGRHRGRG